MAVFASPYVAAAFQADLEAIYAKVSILISIFRLLSLCSISRTNCLHLHTDEKLILGFPPKDFRAVYNLHKKTSIVITGRLNPSATLYDLMQQANKMWLKDHWL